MPQVAPFFIIKSQVVPFFIVTWPPNLFSSDTFKGISGPDSDSKLAPNIGSSLKKVSLLAFTRTGVKDSVRTVHRSCLGDRGNEPLAESCFLDLPWSMAHIDDQPVDLQYPDEGVLIKH